MKHRVYKLRQKTEGSYSHSFVLNKIRKSTAIIKIGSQMDWKSGQNKHCLDGDKVDLDGDGTIRKVRKRNLKFLVGNRYMTSIYKEISNIGSFVGKQSSNKFLLSTQSHPDPKYYAMCNNALIICINLLKLDLHLVK